MRASQLLENTGQFPWTIASKARSEVHWILHPGICRVLLKQMNSTDCFILHFVMLLIWATINHMSVGCHIHAFEVNDELTKIDLNHLLWNHHLPHSLWSDLLIYLEDIVNHETLVVRDNGSRHIAQSVDLILSETRTLSSTEISFSIEWLTSLVHNYQRRGFNPWSTIFWTRLICHWKFSFHFFISTQQPLIVIQNLLAGCGRGVCWWSFVFYELGRISLLTGLNWTLKLKIFFVELTRYLLKKIAQLDTHSLVIEISFVIENSGQHSKQNFDHLYNNRSFLFHWILLLSFQREKFINKVFMKNFECSEEMTLQLQILQFVRSLWVGRIIVFFNLKFERLLHWWRSIASK